MKKILLLDDRINRQTSYTKISNIDLSQFSDVLDNKVGSNYSEVKDNFRNIISDTCSSYSIIIAHESALKSIDQLDFLKEFCKEKEIKLVLFSGGTNYSSFINNLLYINSRDLYSKNLELFLKYKQTEQVDNLELLVYGPKYKINIILMLIENINKFITTTYDDNMTLEQYKDFIKLSIINEQVQIEPPQADEKNWCKVDDLKVHARELKEKLLKKVSNVI